MPDHPRKILVVDDDDPMRFMLSRALTRSGYAVLEAANGTEGRRILAENPVDLMITDIIMPGEEGIETILHVRKSHPALPIIAISGGGRLRKEGYLDLARSCGAHAALAKPFDLPDLLKTIEQVLGPQPDPPPRTP
jgi:DNA-binding NtrC family response regulator